MLPWLAAAQEKRHTPDERINNVTSLPAGPFQITNPTTFPYNAYAASPVHRFYQMWQQLNCSLSHVDPREPFRLQRPTVLLCGSHGWSGHERHHAAAALL